MHFKPRKTWFGLRPKEINPYQSALHRNVLHQPLRLIDNSFTWCYDPDAKMQYEREPDQPFWDLDEALGEMVLQGRTGGLDDLTVRLKAHTERGSYRGGQELYPLAHDGSKHEVSGRAYILMPDITLTVGLYPREHPSGAIGKVTSSDWRGMRHHEIAAVRGLYYEEDRALVIWEVDAFGRLAPCAHSTLWHQVESFLFSRFPQASYIYTDDSEPGEDSVQNRDFLTGLGYHPVAGTARILAKEVRPQ